MLPYYLLLILPFLYIVLIQAYRYNTGKTLIISRKRNVAMFIFFAWLLILLTCRDETIGRDLMGYKSIFHYARGGLDYVFSSRSECLFRLYNCVFRYFTDNYQIYLAVTALITLAPIAYTYMQNKHHSYLMAALFVNMSTFIMMFSGIRQSLAMGVGAAAYQFVRKKKLLPFLLLALVASLLHHSGFMVFFMYPLYHFRIKRNMLPFVVPMVAVTLAFNDQLFTFLTGLLNDSEKYDATISATGAYGSLALFALFVVFAYAVTDEKACDEETLGLRNFLLLAVLLQCFAPLHSLAMRMNYYFILFIPLALSKCLTYPRRQMRQVAQVGEIVICVFFTVTFFVNTYQSYVTGVSTLDTIPYKTFWSGGSIL